MVKYKGFVRYKELVREKKLKQGDRILTLDKDRSIAYKVYDEDRVVKGALSWKVNRLLKNRNWYFNGFESSS